MTAAAPLPAFFGTALQNAHADAIARANKIVSREHHLITTFALSDEIELVEARAAKAFADGDTATYTALYAVARELTALIPA